ncbi:MAG: AAA family ATPase, partial [Alphaproteobacteria bacterium]|nr:AAA family ATPase [Alphaproteobacteria bacterium]
MVQFDRLRLSGFKSFVEPAELVVESGLTGVVGPNGCGKSNLVEALRWVMGETSAKQMRGGEMDDVIFGGTSTRPPRNVAEVAVHLDNSARNAPAMFNDFSELEVTRRIERGSGSQYKVNGREVRARDVQLLFADAATGARSTAMVSQGRVAVLINAKPSERRSLLEEAAGISGLHSRRHEAEQRLKGAEANLERLEDVVSALDTQLGSLKRQARQAARYRALSEQIRRAEAVALHLRWVAAIRFQEQARIDFLAIESRVAESTGVAAAAATVRADAFAALPPLRQAEAEAAARLHRLIAAREQIDAETSRLTTARREAERRWSEITNDVAREAARAADAAAALERLREEQMELEAESREDPALQSASRARLLDANNEVNAIEAELTRQTEALATLEAGHAAALRRAEELKSRRYRLTTRIAEAEATRATLASAAIGDELADSARRLERQDNALALAAAVIEEAESARDHAQNRLNASQADTAAANAAHRGLAAESQALRELLVQEDAGGEGEPLLDTIEVTPGYEAALAAALGDDLLAAVAADQDGGLPPTPDRGDAPNPLFIHKRKGAWGTAPNRVRGDSHDTAPTRYWTPLSPAPLSELPAEALPLERFVSASAALARRLPYIGVIENAAAGHALQPRLGPGQRLVSREGGLWRWDGFTVAAGTPSSAATRLRHRNRLAALEIALADASARLAEATERTTHAHSTAERALAAVRSSRDALRTSERERASASEAHARLMQKAAAIETRLAAVDESLTTLRADLVEAEAEAGAARTLASELDDPAEGRHRMALLRAEVASARVTLVEARAAYDRLTRDAESRQRRVAAIVANSTTWQQQIADAARHGRELDDRRAAVAAEMEELAERPLVIEASRNILQDQIASAETARRNAADNLARAETRLAGSDRAAREAEHALAAVREERVRCEAQLAQGREACQAVATRIAERLACTPEQAATLADLSPGLPPPAIDDAERLLERFLRERESMGPVNLRAEQEVEQLEGQIGGLLAEREDLTAAIARLRHGINEINHEGRERLLSSFEAVDNHFRALFARLFGGGRAHLALTESEDPLLAGLEIMASPPGKRLQILSLLSGGEQALTALALLFAVFLTNPAPICVLDEVDAPLDDANVDRFCSLLMEISATTRTRFLVITHHRMTMARMDRLFGVTMGERGVSQLVSV